MSFPFAPGEVFGVAILWAEELPRGVIEELWSAGVNMDDWDYVLFVPADDLEQYTDGNDVRWRPTSWRMEHMLSGSSDERWQVVTLRGQAIGIGVAYHA